MGTLAYLGQTRQDALASAVVAGSVARVRHLLDEGADPNVADSLGDTPMLWAAALGHLAVFLVLEHHGGDRARRNGQGDTVAHAAARSGHAAMLAYLLQQAEPDWFTAANQQGQTVWSLALAQPSGAVLGVLADHAPAPAWSAREAAGVLHRAMDQSDTTLHLVLRLGADRGWDTAWGERGTPWDRLRHTRTNPAYWRPQGAPVLPFRRPRP